MRKFVLSVIILTHCIYCFSQAGSPDNSFGTNGKVITPIGTSSDYGYAIAIQSDGKLVVVGFTYSSNYDMVVARYNPDGSLDGTFGTGGKVSTSLASADDLALDVEIQPDGKIIVCGRRGGQFCIVRYNSDGSLDATFGNTGIVITNLGGVGGTAFSIALQNDGKILAGGNIDKNSISDPNDFALVRYYANGSLDPTFGTNGIVVTNLLSGPDYLYSIIIQSDSKILAAGAAGTAVCNGECQYFYDAAIVRYNSNGTLDNSFSEDGKVISDFYGANDRTYFKKIHLQADGKIVGVAENTIARYNSDGSLDASFDGDGVASLQGDLYGLVIQTDGKILVAGGPGNFVVARYLTDGSLDAFFDSDGRAILDFGGYEDVKDMVATDNRVYLVGSTDVNGTSDFAIAAIQNPPPDFTPPKMTSGPTVESFDCNSATIIWTTDEPANSGVSYNDGVHFYNQDDETFVTSHRITLTNLSAGATYFYRVSSSDPSGNGPTISNQFSFTTQDATTYFRDLDGDGYGDGSFSIQSCSLPPGYVSDNSDCNDNDPNVYPGAFTNLTPTISLDPSFGNNGSIIKTHPDGATFVSSVLQPDGKLIAYGYTPNLGIDRIGLLARYNVDGSLDAGFGNNGVVSIDIYAVVGNAIAVQQDGKIMVGGVKYISDQYRNVISRYNSDGTSDNSFGVNGSFVMDAGGEGRITSVTLQTDGKIVAGGRWNNQPLVLRLNSNGAPDNSFNGTGIITLNNSNEIASVILQPDGKIIAAGSLNYQSPLLIRYNSNGTIDNSFSLTPGVFVAGLITSATLQPDGKILLLSQDFSDFYYTLSRFNSNGTVDNSFSGGTVFSEANISANSIALQPDGRIVVGGNQGNDLLLARYNINGGIDNSFGENGKSLVRTECGYGSINSLALSDNRIFAVGSQTQIPAGFVLAYQYEWLLNCPGNRIEETDLGICSTNVSGIDPRVSPFSLVNYTLSGATTGSGNGSASGLSFNRGSTAVTYTVVDDPSKSCNFIVTVNDTESPQLITAAANITVNTDPGKCYGTIADLPQPVVTDNCDPAVTVRNSAPSGDIFPKGVTTVTWTFEDNSGNRLTSSQTVTVIDKEPPVFACPSDRTVNLQSDCRLVVPDLITGLTGFDNCNGSISFTQSPAAITYLAGQHNSQYEVTITATDENENSSSCIVTLTAKDVTPPLITRCPQDRNVNLDNNCQITVPDLTQGLTASENCGTVTFTQSIAAGTKLSVSHNQAFNVHVIASDGNGNSEFCTVLLTAKDVIAPTITYCPSVPVQCYNANNTYSIPVLTAMDNCTVPSVSYVITGATLRSGTGNDASGTFDPGISTITWTVADGNGNTSTCTTTVSIDKVDASIPDVYGSSITLSNGQPNTIYIGYGGTSVTLTAQVSSSLSPNSYTYKWTIGSPAGPGFAATQSITVSPTTTNSYFVSIKDANGCGQVSQISKQINVVDITCGTGKIWVCEPQKKGAPLSKCVSSAPNSINRLTAGWYLGECTAPLVTTKVGSSNEPAYQMFAISANPNPSSHSFTIKIESTDIKEPVTVRVVNASGQVIEKRKVGSINTFELGENYRPGLYLVEVSQGKEIRIAKLIKL